MKAKNKRAARGKMTRKESHTSIAGITVPAQWWRSIPAAVGVIAAIWLITVLG